MFKRLTRLCKMSANGKIDKVIVEVCRIVGKGNSLFAQIGQDYHIEGNETQAIDGQIIIKTFGELFNCMWLSLHGLFNV